MRQFEGIPAKLNEHINVVINKLIRLQRTPGRMTPQEAQHTYLLWLQSQELTDKQVFEIYTNTTLKETN